MLDKNKKFNIVFTLLVAVMVFNLYVFWSKESFSQETSGAPTVLVDDPLLRQPGGYHYGRVLRLTMAGQARINLENSDLDIEKCKEAYSAYYSRQTKEEAEKAIFAMHNCER